MRPAITTTLAVALAAILGSAAPAVAGDASCIWNHLPAAGRTAYLNDATNAPLRSHFSDQDYLGSLAACGATANTAQAAANAVIGYALVVKSEQQLGADLRLTPARLDAAWLALTPAQRSAVAARAADPTNGPDIAPEIEAFLGHLALSQSPDNTDGVAMTVYLMSRAAVATYEAQF